ncbi:hypothetical protein Pmani_026355 [Petrolisthes manimaculis]|uniref:Uncharacterized protein n=1 Tax=Petrolisthes manimaculis TaxID=1843537 RepID=A0AAE1TXK5_9EUCA|nr:hypothetical protein Pmani_026355 [Petrolisthes manimaculis]
MYDRPENYNTHKFRLLEKDLFPYLSIERLNDEPGSLVRHRDSIGTRVLQALTSYMNFTYEVREPVDGHWGVELEGGIWTGIVKGLLIEEADFCLDLTVTPQRYPVIQFTGAYVDQSVALLTTKPRPLPEYLSLIRPFEWEVWLAVVAITAVWGTSLWLFQKVWPLALGGKTFSFNSAIFYSWGVMLEDPPADPPNNLTGQLLVGWWLAGSLVITLSYRSSLISHLVVQGKSPEINSVEDLMERDGWSWGTPDMTGAFKTFFSSNPNPAMQELNIQMQGLAASFSSLIPSHSSSRLSHENRWQSGVRLII